MTKKHLEALAGALRLIKPTGSSNDPEATWADAVWAVADVCLKFNPRFDRAKFIHAAGSRDSEWPGDKR